ncbi:MAG: amino-acid N-acetyltransferase [Verrucomicrobia bacterium]|nr:amino-acid N-acetyltransferase [Verrucomicrobiota bacterium]
MKAADLRGILSYSVGFRDKIFVLNIDSAVLTSENFRNLLLDISVLRSLNIRIVLVHGASVLIEKLSRDLSVPASNLDGMGLTSPETLQLALLASSRLAHEILEGLNETDQRAAVSNAVIAHPSGILHGVDQQFTGKVENVDVVFLEKLLNDGIIPVIPPLGFDGSGMTYRVNSDGVALEVSEALKAAKLIFVTTSNGLSQNGSLVSQMSVAEAEDYLKRHQKDLSPEIASKLQHGLRACKNGVARVHIIDGRDDEALLTEIFSNEGIGTMIYANEYEAIRRAKKKDAGAILSLIRSPVATEELVPRTRKEITERIADFLLFEVDRNVVGCAGLRIYAMGNEKVAELECLCVAESHENQGIGRKLMTYAEQKARELGIKRLLALSTQTFNYFVQKGNFKEGEVTMLPPDRRAKYEGSGRLSKILYKDLA